MNAQIKISRRGFRCAYCQKTKKGAYTIVDGEKSCEKCNREYGYIAPVVKVECPMCKGKGYFT